ncbi:DUF4232 domain-containing protein [Streptomyces sp. NPDC004610]|uniref:DUF4232 domain-containing protein n=1 Tax=unclassified Streptomyces TaxID=2593676 RepID=UPI0033B27962
MRRNPLPLPFSLPFPLSLVLVTGALLLTACGTGLPGGDALGTASDAPRPTGCGAPASATPAAAPEEDGVKILGYGSRAGAGTVDCVEYQVTNSGTEALTYTIGFTFADASGRAMHHAEDTVQAVAPGRTVRRTFSAVGSLGDSTQALIATVRRVPADEAPAADDSTCPPSGVRLYADQGDAAMGLRVVGLFVENCGADAYALDGYPRLELLDAGHEPVEGVEILEGGSEIASGTGADTEPAPLTLRRGERARTTLVWRNTTGSGEPVNAPYARVWAKPGADPVTVTPELDLGTTGRLGVGAWAKDDGQG